MKTQKCLSPSKENMSPTKQGFKNGDPITELLGYIKAAGLKLPSHIQKCISQDTGSLIKIVPTDQQVKQADSVKKLKVKLGDTQFELKKIQQDFAHFKLNSRLDKEKQIKKWEQAYNQLKNNLEFSNEDSSIKLLKLRQASEKQLKLLKEKHEAQMKQQKEKLTKSYEQKINNLKRLNQRQVAQLKSKNAEQIKNLNLKYESQIKQLKETQEVQLRKLALKHKQSLDVKEKQFESTYTALQSQKRTQQKLHQKTRIQASQAKQKLYSDLYYQRNVKKDLQETIQKRQQQIKTLKSKIHDLEIDIILQKQRAAKRQKQIKKDMQIQKQGIQQLNKQHISTILSEHDKQLKKYEKSIQQIKQWNVNKQSLMLQRYQQIQLKFEQRPSRQQDLDAIQKLKYKILRKQQQIRALNKQLKNCVMQSQNKQQTYNRIFTSSTMNKLQKKTLSKDREQFKSRQSLCRKSQTTDIKFLLKVYNKHI